MNPSRPMLLVVDDEPEVLRSIHDLFRLAYKVLTFTDPNQALAQLEEHDIPVVMSDQRMPEMTGVDFLRRVKEMRPESTRLLFTGYSDIRAVVDAINEGNVYRYITKPWDPDELSTIIRQAVASHDLLVSRRLLLEELQVTNSQLMEANRVKSAFIEVASHELNTPVAVVLGLTDLWLMTQGPTADPTTRSWIERIHNAGKRLAGIVERMLKLLRTNEFAPTLDTENKDLDELILGVVADLRPFLETRHQNIQVEGVPGLGTAEIDADKIADVLTNLLVNAIKFTPDGRVIHLRGEPIADHSIRFSVSDPGVGISPMDRQHLFEPFFTCFDTLHHSSGQYQFGKRGIGLGLHLVKTFVELHGGVLEEVRSTPNEGSTFSFVLPRHVPRRSPDQIQSSAAPEAPKADGPG